MPMTAVGSGCTGKLVSRLVLCMCAFVLCATLLAGCGGKHIDWDTRIGTYTLEQAIDDYGDPEGFEDLSDGSRMYLWYDEGKIRWYNVLALIFNDQNRLMKVERNERD